MKVQHSQQKVLEWSTVNDRTIEGEYENESVLKLREIEKGFPIIETTHSLNTLIPTAARSDSGTLQHAE